MPVTESPPPPARIAERYTVLSLLGVGGMGSVYRVRDDALDEVVALKMLRRELVNDPRECARFRQEVKLARRVSHPNVARVFDLGEANGEVYLTMEYIQGRTLATRLSREAPLPVVEVANLGAALCAGLGAVHEAGIVHRDFKPENVLLGPGGRVALTDFGIARSPTRDGALVHTQGLILGTPDYMAPEQVEEARDLDARTDVYALGVVLFEMATGQRPFRAPTPLATAVARLTQPPPDPRSLRPGLSEPLTELILACLRRERTARPQTAAEVAIALEALGTGRTLAMAPPSRGLVSEPVPLPAPQVAQSRPGEKRVAVLPFRNLGAPEDAYFAEGLADDITDSLAGVSGLRVRPRATVAHAFAAAGAAPDPIELGRGLEVDVVVEGSVRRLGPNIRIQARLLCTLNGFAIWAQRFEGPVADAFTLSDQVCLGLSEALAVQSEANRTPAADAEAMELYLRGRRSYHRFWREEAKEAMDLLGQAARRSPENGTILSAYALALARVYAMDATDEDMRGELTSVCERALQKDPSMAGPRVALASMHFQQGEPLSAARELRQAVLASPDLADGRELLGRMLIELGDLDAGIGHLHVARALEPAMAHVILHIARAEDLRGRHVEADALLLSPLAEDITPNMLWTLRARLTLWRRDKVGAARGLAALEKLSFATLPQVAGTYRLLLEPERIPEAHALLGRFALERPGASPRLRAFFCQLRAELHALSDERGPAVGAIEEGYALGLVDAAWLDRCPLLSSLEGDPAFREARETVRARARETLGVLNGR